MFTRPPHFLFWVAIFNVAPAFASYQIEYIVGPFQPGVADSWMFDINSSGQATGYIIRRDENDELYQSPVIYQHGRVAELTRRQATFGASTVGVSINDGADVVARLNDDPAKDSFFYYANGQAPVPVAAGDWGFLRVADLNNVGQVLIVDESPLLTSTTLTARLKIWSSGNMQELTLFDSLFRQVLPPDPTDMNSGPSSITAPGMITNINDAGQFAVGRYLSGFDPRDPSTSDDDISIFEQLPAIVYDGAGSYSLLAVPAPGRAGEPISIDSDGAVLGYVFDPATPDQSQLGLWNADGVLQRMLPDPGIPLFVYSGNVARNELGQVLALAADGSGVRMYDPTADDWTDITKSISNLGEGSIYSISAFNDQGQFVGLALHPNTDISLFGYVASPVPEPASCMLALLTIAVSVATHRARFLCGLICLRGKRSGF
jgi:hypothetical protein